MGINQEVLKWASQEKTKNILKTFIVPKTPRQVEIELGIKKIKLAPYLRKKLIVCLNPCARKGRFYKLTNYAKRILKISNKNNQKMDWEIFGWILSSPKQRHAVLKTMVVDSHKRTSEDIRTKASKYNPCLTRISIKGILNELVKKNLVETCLNDRRRYYWITEMGKIIEKNITEIYN